MTYALVRPVPRIRLLDLEAFAAAARLHPDHIRQLVALGLLDPVQDAAGTLWFPPGQLVAVARIERLRAGFSLNYAALGLVVDLLDRVAELESQLRVTRRGGETRSSGIGG